MYYGNFQFICLIPLYSCVINLEQIYIYIYMYIVYGLKLNCFYFQEHKWLQVYYNREPMMLEVTELTGSHIFSQYCIATHKTLRV
jgi:hypothetical protein